jgi:Flp pilus assembly protein TadG
MRRLPDIRREEGQGLVEFALVLPILLMLATAISSFGIVFYRYITLTDAVRSGARTLSLGRGETSPNDPCTLATKQTVSSALDVNLQPNQITMKIGTDPPMQMPQSCDGTGAQWVQGNQVTVSASISCSVNIIFVTVKCPKPTLTASATDAIE